MEFRWLTTEERRPRAVESHSLSDVLALAQQLQSDSEGLVSEEQAVEMGRELGVRPEFVREALRLRCRTAPPPRTASSEPAASLAHQSPMGAVARALLMVFALGMLPLAGDALARCDESPVLFFALLAALIAGWSARYPRLAGISGALAVPVILFVGAFYSHPGHRADAMVLSLLSLCPLCSVAGRAAAKARRWAEHHIERPGLTASDH